jgi:Chaperone of endosialidase
MYWFDIGSRDPNAKVRMRFLSVSDIEASVPWPVASSAALKYAAEDLTEIPDVRDLRVVRYTRLDDPWATERIGFIAEEVAEALPEAAVNYDDFSGPSAYLNEVVTATLVATVQDLLNRIEALESAATP